MKDEMNASNVLLKTDDKLTELSIMSEKARVMMEEVTFYLNEVCKQEFKMHHANNIKAEIAFEYIYRIDDMLIELQKQIRKVREDERSSKAVDRRVS